MSRKTKAERDAEIARLGALTETAERLTSEAEHAICKAAEAWEALGNIRNADACYTARRILPGAVP